MSVTPFSTLALVELMHRGIDAHISLAFEVHALFPGKYGWMGGAVWHEGPPELYVPVFI